MIRGKRIVAVVPAGRRVCMEILVMHLWRNRDVIDEVQFWENTGPEQVSDRVWINTLPKTYGKWANLVEMPGACTNNRFGIARFWTNCQDEDTLYFRFDDDIVYIHPGYFEALTDYRLDNPEPFLIFPQIWHNGLCNYLNQHYYQTLDKDHAVIDEFRYDNHTNCFNPDFAYNVHRTLLNHIENNTADTLLWKDSWDLEIGEHISINSFCFSGGDFASFNGYVDPDEERYLSGTMPRILRRSNAICGWALDSHFAFGGQWPDLALTDVLPRYRQIAEKMMQGDL